MWIRTPCTIAPNPSSWQEDCFSRQRDHKKWNGSALDISISVLNVGYSRSHRWCLQSVCSKAMYLIIMLVSLHKRAFSSQIFVHSEFLLSRMWMFRSVTFGRQIRLRNSFHDSVGASLRYKIAKNPSWLDLSMECDEQKQLHPRNEEIRILKSWPSKVPFFFFGPLIIFEFIIEFPLYFWTSFLLQGENRGRYKTLCKHTYVQNYTWLSVICFLYWKLCPKFNTDIGTLPRVLNDHYTCTCLEEAMYTNLFFKKWKKGQNNKTQ